MTEKSSTSTESIIEPRGGFQIEWFLGDDPRTFETKNGTRTTVYLTDPRRLLYSIVIWLNGDGESLKGVNPGSVISIRLDTLQADRAENRLKGTASREAVDEAFARARSQA